MPVIGNRQAEPDCYARRAHDKPHFSEGGIVLVARTGSTVGTRAFMRVSFDFVHLC
jgi:hypothetical protein